MNAALKQALEELVAADLAVDLQLQPESLVVRDRPGGRGLAVIEEDRLFPGRLRVRWQERVGMRPERPLDGLAALAASLLLAASAIEKAVAAATAARASGASRS